MAISDQTVTVLVLEEDSIHSKEIQQSCSKLSRNQH